MENRTTVTEISICIANYNGEKLLDRCLSAIKNQTITESYEIIVHDDASTDASVELLETHYPEVKLIKSTINKGFCASNNLMTEHASGKYLLLLNNDAFLMNDALETLFDTCRLLNDPVLTLPQYDADTEELLDFGMDMDIFANPIPRQANINEPICMVMGACLWISKKKWEQIGGFPEWFVSIAEDMFICCSARIKGTEVYCTQKSGYKHMVGQSFGGGKIIENSIKTTYKRRSLSERNKTFVMLCCYPTWALIAIFPLHLLLLLLEGTLLSVIKWQTKPLTKIYWPAMIAPLKKIKEIKTTRSHIQEQKRTMGNSFFHPIKIKHHKLSVLIKHGLPSLS